MSDKNGNECAYPVLETNDGINFHSGLTKREVFSAQAPDNIPRWFNVIFSEKENNPDFIWHREGTDFSVADCGFTPKGEQALYFAWRTHYADALLKELSNES